MGKRRPREDLPSTAGLPLLHPRYAKRREEEVQEGPEKPLNHLESPAKLGPDGLTVYWLCGVGNVT